MKQWQYYSLATSLNLILLNVVHPSNRWLAIAFAVVMALMMLIGGVLMFIHMKDDE
jgi:uncharacterized protein YhhL (DUF1145 family)